MEQLINLVTEKTGISQDQAKGAVDTVMGFLKDKIPGIGGQLDGLLKGDVGSLADMAKDKLGL
ncbi:MAG: DUF2267 domain-containing protein [Ignavibacteria bacterium]|nr:DUF2267 domain-containing protein [Ignavibacteria bacterium]